MNGLQLSRQYYFDTAQPDLQIYFPDLYPRLAAGLVGNGSECFGYDDEISRDHDWGVDFYIWVSDDDADRIEDLKSWKQRLFIANPPRFSRHPSAYGAAINAMTAKTFYRQLIGCEGCPSTLQEWVRAPEENLAMCVNGEVFEDNLGEFSAIRKQLLGYLPDDLRKKRIAAKCMLIAQTGQYNHTRMANRGDFVAARTALSKFSDHVIALVFLLNKKYRPYYKWAWRAMSELPVLGKDTAPLLRELAVSPMGSDQTGLQAQIVEQICRLLIAELQRQGLANSSESFMTAQGEEIQASIQNPALKGLPTQYEI
ncbi:MAG: DUF4037 domain-containing protein [Oscillospiraceae bacterium]|nr:DUF4037 domain-containing protein [Oscillospiraceae bacterium]